MPSLHTIAIFFLLAAAGMAAALPTLTDASVNFDYDCLQPDLTTNPDTWSRKEFLRVNLPKPMTPTPIFWSGIIKNGNTTESVRGYAEKCGATLKGATIGQVMCNYNKNVKPGEPKFVMPADDAPAEGYELWKLSSELFARYTSGAAFVATGNARVTSIWFNTEWPTLRGNEDVNIVTGIDIETCGTKCYWYCNTSKLAGCNGLSPCAILLDA